MVTKRETGFTLIEVMLTILVLGLVLAIGVPGFQNSARNARMTTAANDLIAAFQLTRSESIKRRAPVILCVSDNSREADADCITDGSWPDGWIAFADNDRNNALSADDEIVLRHGPLTENESLRVLVTSDDQLADRIVYEPSGFPRPYADGTTGGFVLLCDDRNDNNFSRLLNISQTGRPGVSSLEHLPDGLNLFCQAP